MSNQHMLQELSDDELGLITGGAAHMTRNTYVTQINYSFVFAPVYVVNSTVSNSNINTDNKYTLTGVIHI